MIASESEKPLVLITGAAGNLGHALTRALQQDYRIIGLDRSLAKAAHASYEVDLSSSSSVTNALEQVASNHGRDIAGVIHLAAYFDFTGEESPLYQKVNVDGTRYLLVALQKFNVERFIYSSTMLVHEPGVPGRKINESSPLAPGWAYPKSKAATEEVIQQEAKDIPYTLLRLAGIYDEQTLVPTLSHQVARIYERDFEGYLYAGNTAAGQAFLHKDDMIDAFKRTLERRAQLPKQNSILIGEEECMSYEALQNRIGALLHGEKEWPTISLPKPVAKVGAWLEGKAEPLIPDDFDKGEKPFIRPFMINMASDHYELDISRARELLGWQPTHSLFETLKDITDNLKADAAKWYKANHITAPDWVIEAKEDGHNPNDLLESYEQSYRQQHRANLWTAFINMALGAWLITSPPAMGYSGTLMAYSDVAAGSLLILFALVSLSWQQSWSRWAIAVVGVWLLFAPLAFWTPNAAAYLNGTIIGALAIGFAVALPPAPGVSPVAASLGPTIPPGWIHNPSSWVQRMPIIILAFVGLFISRYLTAYQLGHVDGVWDPFFNSPINDGKNGTESIITSSLSEAWPVPDAGLGALTYTLEILVGLIGSTQRWRTMPWLVTLFGIMIVPLGIVSITFIIIQPILLGTWCTLCLIGAAAMLLQIPYSLDELLATGQFLKRRYKQGKPLLKIFFTGDTDDDETTVPVKAESGTGKPDTTAPDKDLDQSPYSIFGKIFIGGAIGLPWNLVVCLAIGLWLLFTRVTLGHEGNMANWDHLVGALIITVSVCALAEVARPVRFLNIPLALALAITPFVYGVGVVSIVISLAFALALIVLSLPKGKIRYQFGAWNKGII